MLVDRSASSEAMITQTMAMNAQTATPPPSPVRTSRSTDDTLGTSEGYVPRRTAAHQPLYARIAKLGWIQQFVTVEASRDSLSDIFLLVLHAHMAALCSVVLPTRPPALSGNAIAPGRSSTGHDRDDCHRSIASCRCGPSGRR